MGRPRVYDKQRASISVRLPQSLHERLVEAAEERDLSANFLMVRAIEQFLENLIPVDEIEWTRPRAGVESHVASS